MVESRVNSEKAAKKASEHLDSFVGRPKLVHGNFETDNRVPGHPLKNYCEGVISIDNQTRDIGPHTHRMVLHK